VYSLIFLFPFGNNNQHRIPKLIQMSSPLKNVVGPQVRKWRDRKGWTQELLAQKLQLAGWDVSRTSLAKLESRLRRIPDCELLFLSKALGVSLPELFPRGVNLKKLGPLFRP
jgi:transcriptional regulator with XRE-family HTH domain